MDTTLLSPEPIHNRYDPLCRCRDCSRNRAEQIAKIDAEKKRRQEILVESAVKAARQKQ